MEAGYRGDDPPTPVIFQVARGRFAPPMVGCIAAHIVGNAAGVAPIRGAFFSPPIRGVGVSYLYRELSRACELELREASQMPAFWDLAMGWRIGRAREMD